MPFNFYYTALFTEPLVLQLVALVQQNMQAALNQVTGITYPAAGGLQTFVEYDLALLPPETLPQLIVIPPKIYRIDENSQQTERGRGQVDFVLTVGNQDRNVLALIMQQYLRALSMVIDTEGAPSVPNNSGNPGRDMAEMYTSLPISLPFLSATTTVPLQPGSLMYMRVVSHDLGALYKAKFTGFLQTAALSVKIDLEET